MKIYLLRHAETKYNEEGLMQGRENTLLSRKGMKKSEEVRDKLKDLKIDVCFSSPLLRTMQTAFTVVGDRCLINKDDRLIERSLGEYEGKSKEEYDLNMYWNYKLNLSTNGVEPIQDVYKRCDSFLSYLKDNYSDKNVLVVSHSAVIRCFHNILHNCIDKPDGIVIDNCYFEEIDI